MIIATRSRLCKSRLQLSSGGAPAALAGHPRRSHLKCGVRMPL
jgi:hypothetical protein